MIMSEKIKIKVLKGLIRSLLKPIFSPPWLYFFQRAWLDFMTMINVKPKHTQTSIVDMSGLPAQKVVNGQHLTDSKKLFYIVMAALIVLAQLKLMGAHCKLGDEM
jgi:hypothetical protein